MAGGGGGGQEGDTTRLEVAGHGGVDGSRTLLVRATPCSGAAGCVDSQRSYFLLAQVGNGLTDASYGLGADGGPEQFAAVLLDAVATQLVRAVVS